MAWLEKRAKKDKQGRRSGKYYICWRAAGSGRVFRKVAKTDKRASEEMLAQFQRHQDRKDVGLVDVFAAHRFRPIREHLADYVTELTTTGTSAKYRENVQNRIAKLIDACGWKTLPMITADSFCGWRDTLPRTVDGSPVIGPVTQNQYLEAARGFCGWTVRRKRAPSNPLLDVSKADESVDVRRERRALSSEHVAALLAVVDPQARQVYRFMLSTGLRRNETRLIEWGDVALNATTPFIRLRAKTTKSKRSDSLPLHPDVAAELRDARADAADRDRVFARVPSIHMHRKWLAAAGIDWEDEDGRRADVHSLRHTFGTQLSLTGASPRVAMELMRHTDMRLTMKFYTDPRLFDLAGTVAKLTIPATATTSEPPGLARIPG